MEILSFGPGFRRSEGPDGARGVADQTIWSDPRARVTELAFSPRALMPPQTSPDQGIFIVVSGGGWVQVGDDRAAIHHGEAVAWPAGIAHGAWTDGSEMRAILVELPETSVSAEHRRIGKRGASRPEPARGGLAERTRPAASDRSEGEPW